MILGFFGLGVFGVVTLGVVGVPYVSPNFIVFFLKLIVVHRQNLL